MSAAKMLAIGTLLGATVTVGLATMLLYVKPRHGSGTGATARPAVAAMNAAPSVPMPSNITPAAAQPVEPAVLAGSAQLAAFANAEPHLRVTGTAGLAGAEPHRLPSGAVSGTPPLRSLSAHPDLGPRPTTATSPNAVRPNDGSERVGAPGAASGGIVDDALTREASLVAEARALLAAGDAASALRKVRAARAMPSPQLVPEELTVEAQALRSLGMADDARGVDATLHTQYPDSALAR